MSSLKKQTNKQTNKKRLVMNLQVCAQVCLIETDSHVPGNPAPREWFATV